jgi:DNA-binding NarL/FixJ family response regulator
MPIETGSTEGHRNGAVPLTVIVADDHPLMVAGVRRALDRDHQISVVGEAHSCPELIAMVERRRPQIVVMDLRMPGMSGNDCIKKLKGAWPHLKVIVLSACEEPSVIDAALGCGASSFVVKSVESGDLGALIRHVASGEVHHAAARPRRAETPAERSSPELTNREQSILSAIAAGLTTAAISRDLWVSEHTVKFHLTNIYRKLGVANRAAAIRYALDHELIAA